MSNDDSSFVHLTRIVQVIGSDLTLRKWFWGLSRIPTGQRQNELYTMIERMRTLGEAPDLIASFALLAEDSVFEASCQALRECGYMDS